MLLKQYDTAIAEMLLKRDQPPPDLSYLNLEADGSLQAASYKYSPAMVKAIGVSSNRVKKGISNKGCHSDGGAPWASVPKSLEDPIISVAGADYVKRPPIQEMPDDLEQAGCGDLLRRLHPEKEQRDRRRVNNARILEEIEIARQSEEAQRRAKEAEEREKLGALKNSVKCFTTAGLERRAISAPLPGDSDEEDQEYVKRRRMAVARADPPVRGTMGLRIPITRSQQQLSATPDFEGRSTVDLESPQDGGRATSTTEVDVVIGDRNTAQRPSAFWYPKDRQRFKHRMLEELRMTNGQRELLSNGWAQSTDLGGPQKRLGAQSVLAGLPPDERERIEKQALEFLAAKEARDEAARLHYNSMIAKPRPSELRGTIPVTTSPFPHEEPVALREQVDPLVSESVDVAAAADRVADADARHPAGRVYVRPFMFDRPPAFKPLPVYRPELPAARVPEHLQHVERLEMPVDDATRRVKDRRGDAPPWGRETDEDAKWSRIHVNNATKRVEVKPMSKREITAEIRLVTEKGLMKQPRKKVSETLTPAQREFIRSIPSTGPLVSQAMKPASGLPKAGLA
jgi:hypothetical protein